MKVSIIIPFKKGIHFLDDCFISIKEQGLKNFETILVLDHTEEELDSIIEEYKEEINLIVLELTDDKTGVAAARNAGLDIARGEYIYFLDSDDYLKDGTLTKLLELVETDSLDIVYGLKETSWFKRNVYLEANKELTAQQKSVEQYIESGITSFVSYEKPSTALEAKSDEEEEEDSDIELGKEMDDQEEPTLKKGKFWKKDKEVKLADGRIKVVKNIVYFKPYHYLFSRRRAFGNLSILNILFRKEFLDENEIRFDEQLILYCDVPFLAVALDRLESFGCSLESSYIKRKHNDEINLPSISKMKRGDRFPQMVESYQKAREQVKDNPFLRHALEKHICKYYIVSFAPKIRRSRRKKWRGSNFELMTEVMQDINISELRSSRIIDKEGRELLKLVKKGNIKGSIKKVNSILAKKKFKKIIKNKGQLYRAIDKHIFRKLPMKKNWICFESFLGKQYADSCKYIYEYLLRNYKKDYKFIWIINDDKVKIPGNPIRVHRFSLRYFYYMTRSKYWVNNMRQPKWYPKRKGNVFLETWHGTPLKKLVFDMEDVYSASPTYKAEVYSQSRKWDYLVSDNPFSTEVFQSCFMFPREKILEYGYPRNDLMHHPKKDKIAERIRKKVGVPEGKKTILYAPTWRDDEYYGKGQYKFQLQLDLRRLREEFGDEYVILLRTHYFIADSLDVTGVEDFAINVSKYSDITELYLISDICITDYSSVFFDYANLKRPILFFTYDLEKYRDVLRGFYIDIEKEIPGPLLYTNDEVIDAIKNIDKIEEQYHDRYEEFYDRFCALDDGHAAKRIVEKVFRS
ncbi:MAG: CDP-glycerol:glycerophosphate glycerophosphotransferase [Lachnospiraceae bacterium]